MQLKAKENQDEKTVGRNDQKNGTKFVMEPLPPVVLNGLNTWIG